MTTRSVLALLAAFTLTGVSALATDPKTPSPAKKEDGELALTGLDPVLLVQGKETKGDEKFTTARKGLRYRFADAANQTAFEKSPEKYEVQFDGGCAGMPSVKGDLSLFTVHKGKIYVFASAHCRTGFLKEPDEYTKSRKVVAVYIHDGVELLDFAGPGEVFASAKGGRAFQVVTVASDAKPITSQGFLKVTPTYTFVDCPKPDIIVLPGGATSNALKEPRLVEWVKKASADAEVTLSVCTGVFILAEAGLLDGKEATTHWGSIDTLKKTYPKVKVHADKRWVDNGKVVTAAGVSAGIDASLHVVEKLHGKDVADATAKYMEYRRNPESSSK